MTLALIGTINSLLTAMSADSLTGHRHKPNREVIGAGLGNAVAGMHSVSLARAESINRSAPRSGAALRRQPRRSQANRPAAARSLNRQGSPPGLTQSTLSPGSAGPGPAGLSDPTGLSDPSGLSLCGMHGVIEGS